MERRETTQTKEAEEQNVGGAVIVQPPETQDWLKQFYDHADLLPPIAQSAAFVMLDVARKDPDLGQKMREKLWHHAQAPALIQDDDTPEGWWMSFWSDLVKDDEATTETETPSEADQPKTQREEIHEAIDNLATELGEMQQAKQAEPKLCKPERMLRKWLLEQDYKAKLASLMLATLRFDDHGTNKLANEIYDSYEADILAVAADPPENMPRDELLMTGVVVEQGIWHEHF
jgi:hypothetical protein